MVLTYDTQLIALFKGMKFLINVEYFNVLEDFTKVFTVSHLKRTGGGCVRCFGLLRGECLSSVQMKLNV